MALSYSGIVNYGKVTLPSVESWGTNMNILKDPPKSVHTRKIDKVGETSAITTSIDESGDRFCEAINYYARGQNPMVSVSYGQGQQKSSNISRGEAFLPYRVARDGAFRPPVWRQEDLLPLSRMPRIWTEVNTQPYKPVFTKRIRDCGTAEGMREVKNQTLQVACAANKTVAAYPNVNQPDMKPGIVTDPLALGQVGSQRSCVGANASEIVQRMDQGPILLAPSRPIASGATNPAAIKEMPIVLNNVKLTQNHPTANATTNFAAPSMSGYNPHSDPMYGSASGLMGSYTRLPHRSQRGGFDGNQGIPSVNMNHPTKNLIKVR
ncbi:hypothetical protein [carnivorous sponge associated iridovirus]|jgi:hypothetical protein|nr:hypothetical protein [carnivorous sponge associated iridovirus]